MDKDFAWHIPSPEALWLPDPDRDDPIWGFRELEELKRRYPRVQDHPHRSQETLQSFSVLGCITQRKYMS